MIKEVLGKTKLKKDLLPKRLVVKGSNIYNKAEIADSFNKFFVNIGPKLSSNIRNSKHSFKSYLTPNAETMNNINLTNEELQKAFSTLQLNKSPGYDDISINIVKSVFDIIESSLCYIFNLSLNSGVFPDKLKIARILPVFKSADESILTNYRPISILPCFSKILERIMYNRLYRFLCSHDILYEKQFGFQAGNSTDHAIIQLTQEIFQSFNENKFTLGVFIDLSKAFDTVNHNISLSKLENYGIKNTNLKWFESYLSLRKQFVSYGQKKHKI